MKSENVKAVFQHCIYSFISAGAGGELSQMFFFLLKANIIYNNNVFFLNLFLVNFCALKMSFGIFGSRLKLIIFSEGVLNESA